MMYTVVLVVCYMMSLISITTKASKINKIALSIFNILLLCVHLLIWGFRAILIPSYLIIIISIMSSIFKVVKKTDSKLMKRSKLIVNIKVSGIIVWFVVSLITLYLFPNFSLPTPTGSFAIGTMAFEVTDTNREEFYTQEVGDHRKLMVQVWYPAEKDLNLDLQTYPKQVAEALNSVLNVPDWLFGYFSNINTHTYIDAKVLPLDTKYPLIVFSPGNNSTRFQNTAVIEELVSSGYVVIGVDHPYTSNDVAYTDGTIAYRSDGQLEVTSKDEFYEREINIRTEDLQFVIQYLKSDHLLTYASEIVKQIDFDQVGMLGHSYGGATIVETMAREPYIKVGVSYDGGLWGKAVEDGISQPLLYMSASQTLDYMDDTSIDNEETRSFVTSVVSNLKTMQDKSTKNFVFVLFEGYNHYSFTDIPLISPLFQRSHQSVTTTIQYTKTFFDHYLKGSESSDVYTLINESNEATLIEDLKELDSLR